METSGTSSRRDVRKGNATLEMHDHGTFRAIRQDPVGRG
jgi:hypothetical protein